MAPQMKMQFIRNSERETCSVNELRESTKIHDKARHRHSSSERNWNRKKKMCIVAFFLNGLQFIIPKCAFTLNVSKYFLFNIYSGTVINRNLRRCSKVSKAFIPFKDMVCWMLMLMNSRFLWQFWTHPLTRNCYTKMKRDSFDICIMTLWNHKKKKNERS